MKHGRWIPVTLLVGGLLFGSCQREEVAVADDETIEQEITEENVLADQYFEDLASLTEEGAKGEVSSYRMISPTTGASQPREESTMAGSCVTLTHQTTEQGGIITIDFGTENCLCKDERYRRGKIVATYTGIYYASGATVTITPEDYYVNDFRVEGTKQITNKGENEDGHVWFEVSVNGAITRPDGRRFTYMSTQQRVWLEGDDTSDQSDDVFGITGNASGVSARGIAHSTEISEAIIIKRTCHFPVSGIATFKREGKRADRSLTIDYGDGSCDNLALVTNAQGQSLTIELR